MLVGPHSLLDIMNTFLLEKNNSLSEYISSHNVKEEL